MIGMNWLKSTALPICSRQSPSFVIFSRRLLSSNIPICIALTCRFLLFYHI